MNLIIKIIVLLFFLEIHLCLATEIKIVNVSFPGPLKPKTEVDYNRNWYTNHFSVSSSYKTEVELAIDIPMNTAFNVRLYAIVYGNRISLGDARVGRAQAPGPIFVAFYIYPSSANYYGQCEFVCVVDADNEIVETDESPVTNEWRFNATIHRPGESY